MTRRSMERILCRFGQPALVMAVCALLGGTPPSAVAASVDIPEEIQEGDVVQVHVTASREDGTVMFTTKPAAARAEVTANASDAHEATLSAVEEVVAGSATVIPGLGKAVLGMKAGAFRKVTVPADEAFGKPNPELRQDFPCVRRVPKVLRLPADRYLEIAGTFPKEGQEVELVPYMKTRVVKVEDAAVVLEFMAEDGFSREEEFGTVIVEVGEEDIVTRLKPRMGAAFVVEGKSGSIVSSDGVEFTVDFNPPGAGQSLILDLEVMSRIPAQRFADKKIAWEQNYDQTIELARQQGKPVVLVLYADWCSWCKRLFGESLEDPRIRNISEQFVWLKINSDVEKQYKERFQQTGFPMVVVLGPDGKTAKKIEGFRDGETLYRDLRSIPTAM